MDPVAFAVSESARQRVMDAISPEDAIVALRAQPPAVARIAVSLHVASRSDYYCAACRVVRRARDDIDHSIYGVRAPDRRHRSAHHLDALDLVDRHILRQPVDAADGVVVDAPAIDQNQELIAEGIAEPADAYGPQRAVRPSHFHARSQTEQLGQRSQPGTPDHLACDHEHRSSRIGQTLVLFGCGSDFDVRELLKRGFTLVRDGYLACERGAGQKARADEDPTSDRSHEMFPMVRDPFWLSVATMHGTLASPRTSLKHLRPRRWPLPARFELAPPRLHVQVALRSHAGPNPRKSPV